MPDHQYLQTNATSEHPAVVALKQEDCDRLIASWGVSKPYVLFSRRASAGNNRILPFPVPDNERWNEMVIYPKVQDASILAVRLSDQELSNAIQGHTHLHYEQQFLTWNIHLPMETCRDFINHNEWFERSTNYGVASDLDARIHVHNGWEFPELDSQLGQPVGYDLDGYSPLYFGSARLKGGSHHPCKVGPHLNPPTRVSYDGKEIQHFGSYDILPFDPVRMKLVRTSYGRIPPGMRPVQGGFEDDGAPLYHAIGTHRNLRVPGKVGEHLPGCHLPYDGKEIIIEANYEILYVAWFLSLPIKTKLLTVVS
jgi:hypothetical protein